jgi:hypothetical protein
MNKEAIVVVLDANISMDKEFSSGEKVQTRFEMAVGAVKMLCE